MMMVSLVQVMTAFASCFIVPGLSAILPPTVAGVGVCDGGLALVQPALSPTLGMNDGSASISDALIGGITLAVIMAMSIWGNRAMRLFALLTGIIAGIALSALFGELHGGSTLLQAPLFGLPSFVAPRMDVPIGVLVAVALLALMVQLDTFACVVLMQKMNDADWRRANMQMVSGGIRASALGTLLTAPLGGFPNSVSSANLALCHISRSTSRWIGLAVAALLILLAFMPMLAQAMTLIPTAVIGAVEIYAAAYLIVSGVELIASRAMDARGIFMVGLSFVAGIGVMLMPDIGHLFPESLSFISQNGIVVAGLTAILLNLAFRMGSSRRNAEPLHDVESDKDLAKRVVGFVESSGAAWGARHEAIRRAAQASLEAVELLHASGGNRRASEIRGRFDEFNLDIEILHEGGPLTLSAPYTQPGNLLDADDDAFEAALEQTMQQVSHNLLQRITDSVHAEQRHGQSRLRLHFDH